MKKRDCVGCGKKRWARFFFIREGQPYVCLPCRRKVAR